jgi:hypothetical protein
MDAPAAPAGGALALSPLPVSGGRRHKLKLVTKKRARKVLKKLGLKMRGGADAAPGDEKAAVALPAPLVDAAKTGGADEPEMEAGRRRRKTRKGRRASRRSIFGY